MSELDKHIFLGLPAHKPRVWVDLSSTESKRAGLAMHRPGRKVLQWAVKILGWFAWLPIEKILKGPVKRFNELDGSELIEKMIDEPIEFITYYMGNGSAKSKYTILIQTKSGSGYIAKLGKTTEAGAAIRREAEVLKELVVKVPSISYRIPVMIGEVGSKDNWAWSVQTVLPKGSCPVRLQKEHYEFLGVLKTAGLSHGDFTPWNCSIVDGQLVAWDWEDAGPYVEGKDEAWFKKQVKELLGVDA